MSQTIVALYESLEEARRVVKALTDAGFDHEAISLVAPDPEGKHGEVIESRTGDEQGDKRDTAADGAMLGGAIGAIAGLLFGLSAFTIPGLGPIVIAGPIYTTVFGAGAGGLSGGLIGALVKAGIPEEEAHIYREGIRRGHTLVAVEAQQDEKSSAIHILEAHDPLDLETAVEEWRTSGWEGPSRGPDQFVPGLEDEEEETEHKYATGALGADLEGRESTRDLPPMPTHADEEEEEES